MKTERPLPNLPPGISGLCEKQGHRIPKIAIGNPGEQRELAWDIVTG